MFPSEEMVVDVPRVDWSNIRWTPLFDLHAIWLDDDSSARAWYTVPREGFLLVDPA
jgi:hypothetical protein